MIGRKEEKMFLQSLLCEEEPHFVAVFGRRRIGKTYLVIIHCSITNFCVKDHSMKTTRKIRSIHLN